MAIQKVSRDEREYLWKYASAVVCECVSAEADIIFLTPVGGYISAACLAATQLLFLLLFFEMKHTVKLAFFLIGHRIFPMVSHTKVTNLIKRRHFQAHRRKTPSIYGQFFPTLRGGSSLHS